jgi:hypothetical protein
MSKLVESAAPTVIPRLWVDTKPARCVSHQKRKKKKKPFLRRSAEKEKDKKEHAGNAF